MYIVVTGAAGFIDEVYDNVPCLSDCGNWHTFNVCPCTSLSVAAGATVRADFALSAAGLIGGAIVGGAIAAIGHHVHDPHDLYEKAAS